MPTPIEELYEQLAGSTSPADFARAIRRADEEMDDLEAEGFRETAALAASARGIDFQDIEDALQAA